MPEPQPLPTDAPTFPYPVTFRRLHRHTPSIPQPLPESTDDLASHTLPASTHKPTKPRKMLRGGGSTCPNPSPVPPPPGNVSPVAQAHPQPLPRTHPRPLQEHPNTPKPTKPERAQTPADRCPTSPPCPVTIALTPQLPVHAAMRLRLQEKASLQSGIPASIRYEEATPSPSVECRDLTKSDGHESCTTPAWTPVAAVPPLEASCSARRNKSGPCAVASHTLPANTPETKPT